MDAKKYLRKIELYDVRINSKLQEVQTLRTMATKITATMSDAPVRGSGNQDKLGDSVARIVDLEAEINRDVDAYVDLKQEAYAVLDNIKDADQVQVLYKRYFEYKPWEQIACEMNCNYRNILYIHGKALQAVEEILNA